jgi:hypothetical protein
MLKLIFNPISYVAELPLILPPAQIFFFLTISILNRHPDQGNRPIMLRNRFFYIQDLKLLSRNSRGAHKIVLASIDRFA